MRAVLLVVVLVTLSQTALAEERVLYCTETDNTGFVWQEGQTEGEPTLFKKNRFIVTVLSEEKRTVTRDDGLGFTKVLTCRKPFPPIDPDLLTCDDVFSVAPWLFNGNKFVRVFLHGPPVGGLDRVITISYGTCTEF